MRFKQRFMRMLMLGFGVLSASCMTSPRDGLHLQSTWSTVPFEGMTLTAGSVVSLKVLDLDTNAWFEFATITAGTDAVADDVGTPWFKWGKRSFMIPDQQKYWARNEGSNTVYAQVKASDANGDIFSFLPGADACLEANRSAGGIAMGMSCHSSHSPVARISAPCGTEGIVSCDGYCSPGLVQDHQNRCRRCGGQNQLCCNKGTLGATGECGANLTCLRSQNTCLSGTVINPPGSVPQGCSFTNCSGEASWDGSPGCVTQATEANCWGVAEFCKDIRLCGGIRSESGWYWCGVCIGVPW